ncbi:hypothetical protein FBU30_002796, partial [Linnemannia zychae]
MTFRRQIAQQDEDNEYNSAGSEIQLSVSDNNVTISQRSFAQGSSHHKRRRLIQEEIVSDDDPNSHAHNVEAFGEVDEIQQVELQQVLTLRVGLLPTIEFC